MTLYPHAQRPFRPLAIMACEPRAEKGGDTAVNRMETKRTGAAAARAQVRAAWVEAMRLRTLPLAASGSFVAAGLAAAYRAFRPEVLILMLIVSVLLQVIANFADDYGDLAHGLDDETRVGPQRGMQRGIITPAQMHRALMLLCALTFGAGCLLIYIAFSDGPAWGPGSLGAVAAFVALGIAAIAAAVLYTVGPHPYGYLGLGDVMSFLFFGVVSVVAGTFLYTHAVEASSIVAAVALGLPVAAVMNVNNMRDSLADAAKGKHTIAYRLYRSGWERGERLAQGKSPEEIARLASKLSHGSSAAQRGPAHMGGKDAALVHMTPADVLASLSGESRMRVYHLVLGYASIVLFVISLVLARGPVPATALRALAVIAASIPLTRTLKGTAQELDHEKLDRFMAPTSMGTVLISIAYAIAVALG